MCGEVRRDREVAEASMTVNTARSERERYSEKVRVPFVPAEHRYCSPEVTPPPPPKHTTPR